GDKSIGDALNYDYERGDVIIFQQQGRPDFIKRIIAASGDTIMVEDNKLIVNGMEIDEKYIPSSPDFKLTLPNPDIAFLIDGQERTVPQNKYFVMGDNRQHSQDSRFASVGWVDRSEIKGKVFLRYWPLGSFGLIPRGKYEEMEYNSNDS
ncbi:MAG TPA: signal peptidase I, partial [Candidatus Dojkabacteria bacterium]